LFSDDSYITLLSRLKLSDYVRFIRFIIINAKVKNLKISNPRLLFFHPSSHQNKAPYSLTRARILAWWSLMIFKYNTKKSKLRVVIEVEIFSIILNLIEAAIFIFKNLYRDIENW